MRLLSIVRDEFYCGTVEDVGYQPGAPVVRPFG